MNLPEVSVVIATRDRPEMMRQAVRCALEQEYAGPIEVVVVYDQSEPDPDLADSFELDPPRRRLTVTTNARQAGLAGARNHGIGVAGGELVAFCDDDDYWLAGKLGRQVEMLQATPGASLVSCGIRVIYGEETFDRALDRTTDHVRGPAARPDDRAAPVDVPDAAGRRAGRLRPGRRAGAGLLRRGLRVPAAGQQARRGADHARAADRRPLAPAVVLRRAAGTPSPTA